MHLENDISEIQVVTSPNTKVQDKNNYNYFNYFYQDNLNIEPKYIHIKY